MYINKPVANLIGANGNIFNLMGIARRALNKAHLKDQANKMCDEILDSGSYEEALNIISNYVEINELVFE